jgi:hypothetical protein
MPDSALSIPVAKVVQPVGTFFTGSVDAYALLDICKFDFRRISDAGGYKEFLGFQRKLDLKRVRSIERYIQTVDAVFPTAIVISVDEKCASIETDASGIRLVTAGGPDHFSRYRKGLKDRYDLRKFLLPCLSQDYRRIPIAKDFVLFPNRLWNLTIDNLLRVGIFIRPKRDVIGRSALVGILILNIVICHF